MAGGVDGAVAREAVWIHGPLFDTALAFVWVPFLLVARALEHDPHALALFAVSVFLLSASHQPLTLPLVYGDRDQYESRRALFMWSPLVFLLLAVAGMSISITLVAIVAGLWNAEHTIMQRYGVTRIYGRKVGDTDGRLERIMYFAWHIAALVWVAADGHTPDRIDRLPAGQVNHHTLTMLASLRPGARLLLLPVVAATAVITIRWLAAERRLPRTN
ncbi:MAG TPA: hypothetical protein VH479_01100, partial [Acidimicrobiales bacterium]